VSPSNGSGGTPSGDVAGLLAQAESAYNDAQTALKNGNLSDYQKAVDRMADLIRQSRAAAAPSTTTTAPAGQAATTTTVRK
jgi:hypothetical protein